MKDLIKTLELALDEQKFITLNEKTTVSIILEYSYWYTDRDGKVCLSNDPVGYKLNIAIQQDGENMDYYQIDSEEEFYSFMKKVKNDEIKYSKVKTVV